MKTHSILLMILLFWSVIGSREVDAQGLANTPWPMIGQNPQHTGRGIAAVAASSTVKWKFQIGSLVESSPAIGSDGTVYVGSQDTYLYAITSDGTLKWKFKTGDKIESSPAIGSDGTVYVGSWDNYLYAIKSDGALKWKCQTFDVVPSSPAIGADGTVYVGSSDKYLYAIKSDGTLKWKFLTGDNVYSSPAIGTDGTVYVGSQDKYLYAVNSDGTLKWKFQTGGAVWSSPAIGSDGAVYVGSGDNYLYAFAPETASVTVSSPNGGESWTAGTSHNITWTSSGVTNVKLEYSTNNGSAWTTIIASTAASAGSYAWTLPEAESATCLVRISDASNAAVNDQSNAVFIIAPAVPTARILVTYPNGGEKLYKGKEYVITWSSSEVSEVKIEYSTDNGTTWKTVVAKVTASSGSYRWTVPDAVSSSCRIRISDTGASGLFDTSDALFSIVPPPSVTVTSPKGGERWVQGTQQSIAWDANEIASVTIEFSPDNGKTWTMIASGVSASDGKYTWKIPEVNSTQCLVKISSDDGAYNDTSDEVFTIKPADFVRVLAPANGDTLTAGASYFIRWEYIGATVLKIELSLNNGTDWTVIRDNVPASTGSFSWTVPDTSATMCKIRITDTVTSALSDTSDGVFTIKIPGIKIAHTSITEAKENSALTFSVTVTADAGVKSVDVFHDVSGKREFKEALRLETTNGRDYSGIIQEGVFTAEGMEYYIVARDSYGKEERSPSESGYWSIRAEVERIVSGETVKGGSEQNAYRMISLPFFLSNSSIAEQMKDFPPSGEPPSDWRLFRFSPGENEPKEYPNIEGFSPGIAFWLITRNDYSLKTSNGTTVSTIGSFSITLESGWNDIANPWMFDISWNDIANPSNANLSKPYSYEGSWSDPTASPLTLKPWTGYAVKNLENRTVMIRLLPNHARSIAKETAPDPDLLWTLSLTASAGLASDRANHVGVRRNASPEWDWFDEVEPPVIGEYVSVSFPHLEWTRFPSDYTVDFRPPQGPLSWDFDVRTNIPHEKVTVSLEGLDTLPAGTVTEVFDRDTGSRLEVIGKAFSFISGGGITERRYALSVTGAAEPGRDTAAKPGQFVTAHAYPNPFNPRTVIRYELSAQGNVIISVFNAVGQKVREYPLGRKESRVHELVFDAAGLTSGLYIYRVDAGYATATEKMLFMK